MKEWVGDIQTNDFARDTKTGEPVLVTNGLCVLLHTNQEHFRAAHVLNDGYCCYTPYEGLVFKMDGDKVKGWSMKDITGRTLQKLDGKEAESIRKQMDAILEKLRSSQDETDFGED